MLSVLQDYGAGVQQQHAMHHHGAPVPGMHEAQQTMQVHDMMAHLTPEQLAMMHANLAAAGPPGGAQMDGQVGRMQLQYCCIASHSWGPDGRVGGSHAAAILLHSEPQLFPFLWRGPDGRAGGSCAVAQYCCTASHSWGPDDWFVEALLALS